MANLFSFVRADGSTMGASLLAVIDTVRHSRNLIDANLTAIDIR